ncbi:MAG: hypothetical protein HY911_04425 [Desulfobacterales bacterium]|nr:hypothetical protein [Desulfobacterales bacterium]
MRTDKWWMSALWGRIGAAVVLIGGTFLQASGIDVTPEQMDHANTLIDSLISNLHILVATAMVIISKLREGKKVTTPAAPAASQQGSIGVPIVMGLALACVVAISIGMSASGCATRQGAVQQISTQTNDPGVIALASFADAQDAYIAAIGMYQPYHRVLRDSNPALAREIVGYFRSADKVLSDWERLGDLPLDDKAAFREYLREISIRTAQLIEKGGSDE